MITEIGTVSVYVTDQDKALAYYSEKLGFEKRADQPMGPGQRWLEVAPPGAQTRIILYKPTKEMPGAGSLEEAEKLIGRELGMIFEADDIEQTFKDFKEKGVIIKDDLKEEPWGWFGTIADPDGNTFGIHKAKF